MTRYLAVVALAVGGCAPLDGVRAPEPPEPPRAQRFNTCAQMRAAGWTEGVYRYGGTYDPTWNQAERHTYGLNLRLDRLASEPVSAPAGDPRLGPLDVAGRGRAIRAADDDPDYVCER